MSHSAINRSAFFDEVTKLSTELDRTMKQIVRMVKHFSVKPHTREWLECDDPAKILKELKDAREHVSTIQRKVCILWQRLDNPSDMVEVYHGNLACKHIYSAWYSESKDGDR